MPKSNDNGRVLEYLIVKSVQEMHSNDCSFSEDTIRQNKRDSFKLSSIDGNTLSHYKKNVPIISNWIIQNFLEKDIIVLRISDNAGIEGDVTDIRINSENTTLNISCKNNNLSIKHQRPGATPKQFGFSKNENKLLLFKSEYKEINSKFFKLCKALNADLKEYNEISDEFKKQKLYEPICKLVSDFINKNSDKGEIFQNFLLGNINYKQIVLWKKNIEIKSFDDFSKSKKVSSELDNRGYIIVNFHNGIILSFRLHNASSKITEKGSLKFDTKLEIDIPTHKLNCL